MSLDSADAHTISATVTSGWRRRRTEGSRAAYDEIDPGPIDGRQVYKRNMYEAGQISTLMARYVRVRGDLLLEYARLAETDDVCRQAALVCKEFLDSARRELESRRPSLSGVVNVLGLAERMLVTLYRPEILQLRVQHFLRELEGLEPVPSSHIASLEEASTSFQVAPDTDRDVVETALKDAITYVNGCAERDLLEDDLQVSRLSRVHRYLCVAWVLLLVSIPVVSSVQTLGGEVVWPLLELGRGEYADLLFGALGLSVVGAVGGVVSGMLNVRDTKATMLDYRSSLKRLALKPLVGAVAALVVYLFLSAQLVSGIEITSAGTYVVLAFVAGFSERYFLSVISAQTGKGQGREAAAVTGSTAAKALQ